MKTFLVCLLFLITYNCDAQIVSIPIPGSPLSLSVMANPQPLQNINNNTAATSHNLGDDGWANVPLPFNFPFYGSSFNTSTMYSNGAVQFGNPVTSFPAGNNAFCCQGQPLNTSLNSAYNYSIMPLWTDLYGPNRNHYTLGTSNSMTYGWYNVEQYGNSNNKSSFELKVDSTGGIDMRWSGALVTMAPVTIGTVGNAALGEFTQNYYSQQGINITSLTQLATGQVDLCVINPLSSPACPGYQSAYTTQQCAISALYDASCPGYAAAYYTQQCYSNPLYDSGCPGYSIAYHDQQCSINALYATDCQGYAAAYKTQQCSISSLYSTDCPGYAAAYKTQQCGISALYATDCPGYAVAYHDQQCNSNALYMSDCPGYAAAYKTQQCTANPLYATDCPGYAVAYKNQQCSISPLYATDCPGYAAAYHDNQCRASALYMSDCPGYAVAYKSQQCSISALYATDCPGYAAAYKSQQCSLNALYATDCPGYAVAYFNQQCLLDSLYDRKCEGYSTAYAIKYLVNLNPVVTDAVNSSLTNTAQTAKVATVNSNGTVSTSPQLVSDPTVNTILTAPPPSTSTTSPTSVTSVVNQPPPPPPGAANNTQSAGGPPPPAPAPNTQQAQRQQEQKQDDKKTEASVAKIEKELSPKETKSENNSNNSNREKVKDAVTAKAKEISKDVSSATTMEQQVASQGVLVGLIGFVPGFSAYQNSIVPDTNGVTMIRQYGKPVIDNQTAQRRLNGASELKWNEIVNSQYQLGK